MNKKRKREWLPETGISSKKNMVNKNEKKDLRWNSEPSIHDLQDLLIWSLHPKRPYMQLQRLQKSSLLHHRGENVQCIVAIVPYLDSETLDTLVKDPLLFLRQRRQHIHRMLPGFIHKNSTRCSILEALLTKRPKLKSKNTQVIPLKEPSSSSLEAYLLTEDSFIPNGFSFDYKEWRSNLFQQSNVTIQSSDTIKKKNILDHVVWNDKEFHIIQQNKNSLFQMLGIDCEMCQTNSGKEVIRISCVRLLCDNFEENKDQSLSIEILYDTKVAPEHPVVDYLTRFSGLAENDMKDVSTTLHDVQCVLNTLITPETILVGHSLDNDLSCLKMFHNRIIDTALLYPHCNSFSKNSLAFLAKTILGRDLKRIRGHDSVDDAAIPLGLVLFKLVGRTGSSKNVVSYSIPIPLEQALNRPVNIWDSMHHDTTSYPLLNLIQNNTIMHTSEEPNDASVMKLFLTSIKTLCNSNNNNDLPHSSPPLHICFLRDYQRLCHETIGGVSPTSRPKDFYCVKRRMNQLAATCMASSTKKVKKLDTTPATEISSDWLSSAFGNETKDSSFDPSTNKPFLPELTTNDNNSSSPRMLNVIEEVDQNETCIDNNDNTGSESEIDISEDDEEKDNLGETWVKQALKDIPIRNPRQLFPHPKESIKRRILADINTNLLLLYDSLASNDLLVILTWCGNPVPKLGLDWLQTILNALEEKKHPSLNTLKSTLCGYTSHSFNTAKDEANKCYSNPFYAILQK